MKVRQRIHRVGKAPAGAAPGRHKTHKDPGGERNKHGNKLRNKQRNKLRNKHRNKQRNKLKTNTETSTDTNRGNNTTWKWDDKGAQSSRIAGDTKEKFVQNTR